MIRRRIACAFSTLVVAAPLPADDRAPARDEYDAFVAAFTIEQHLTACEHRAPGVYREFSDRISGWRKENQAIMQRWEPAARKWELPGNVSVDDLLVQIATSTDEDYAALERDDVDARCKSLLRGLLR